MGYMLKKKYYMSWEEIKQGAMSIVVEHLKTLDERKRHTIYIYGIPRGGIPVASAVAHAFANQGAFAKLVEVPGDADVFVDDIIDSGKTKERYGKYKKPFYALIDKTKMSKNNKLKKQWIEFPWERMIKEEGPEENITRILQYLGEDVEREGLKETPTRVVKSWKKLFGGYKQDPKQHMKIFEEKCDELIVVKDIEFFSTCEHHMLPFFGKAHIGYIPNGKVIGVSKIPRILEVFTRRLQIQERIGAQVCDVLNECLDPLGVGVVLEAKHFCMVCRGIEKQNSIMKTSCMLGVLRTKPEARQEFLEMIK